MIFVLCLLLVLQPAAAQTSAKSAEPKASSDAEISALNQTAWQLSHAGKKAEAVPLMERALHLAEQKHAADPFVIAFYLNNLGHMYFELQKYDEAEAVSLRLLTILEGASDTAPTQIWAALGNLWRIADAQGLSDVAQQYRLRMTKIEEQVTQPLELQVDNIEAITSDLRRVWLRHCGAVRFAVVDRGAFMSGVADGDIAAKLLEPVLFSVVRARFRQTSFSEVGNITDALAVAMKTQLDERGAKMGITVKDIDLNLRSCVALAANQ